VIWFGYAIWWELPGAELGCFFASLAVVGTWGDSHQVGWSAEARGSRGGAPGGAALTFAPGRAAGAVFWGGGGSEIRIKKITPLPPRLQFRNWVPELPLTLTYLGHRGGSQCIYTPLSASTSSKKLIPSWWLRQREPGVSRGL
jgi:hypothetical protein